MPSRAVLTAILGSVLALPVQATGGRSSSRSSAPIHSRHYGHVYATGLPCYSYSGCSESTDDVTPPVLSPYDPKYLARKTGNPNYGGHWGGSSNSQQPVIIRGFQQGSVANRPVHTPHQKVIEIPSDPETPVRAPADPVPPAGKITII
jgi:hypothetical protein